MTQSLAASRAESTSESAESLPWWRSASFPSSPERQLAGDEQERAGADETDIIRDRRRGFGQNDAHLFQTLGGLAHGGAELLGLARGRAGAKLSTDGPRLCRLSREGKLVFALLGA